MGHNEVVTVGRHGSNFKCRLVRLDRSYVTRHVAKKITAVIYPTDIAVQSRQGGNH